MNKRFQNKTVLITGASAGIGAACARRFFQEGANVILTARTKEPLEETEHLLGDESRVFSATADVSDVDTMKKIFETAEDRFGAIHILVNNAGFNERGPLESIDTDDLAHIVDVNLKAPILLTRLILPYIRRAGGGAIINVASIAGRVPLDDEATYSATKFGLRAFSLAVAEELQNTGITVSVVSPGPVNTGFLLDEIDTVPDLVFSQPITTPDEVATLVLDCALDGKKERVLPKLGGAMASFAYLFPLARRTLKPIMKSIGKRNKEKYRNEHS